MVSLRIFSKRPGLNTHTSLSIWLNSVDRWVHPLVGRVYALPRVVISLFRDSDFEDLATGLLLSLGPTCGTLFRPKLDNRVTISYSSRVNWKHFCSSSPEPFCGSISNDGPYKYSKLYYYYYYYYKMCYACPTGFPYSGPCSMHGEAASGLGSNQRMGVRRGAPWRPFTPWVKIPKSNELQDRSSTKESVGLCSRIVSDRSDLRRAAWNCIDPEQMRKQ